MPDPLFLISIPGLREQDLAHMPRLKQLADAGNQAELIPSFPAVTCPAQVNLTTGCLPMEHGVVANGFYWRDHVDSKTELASKTNSKPLPYDGVEMWTAWDEIIEKPRVWNLLKEHNSKIKTAVWFPLLAKGCEADFICTPAPIHNPDGSESLWCYTRPEAMYGELRDELGHFPLKHFWGPLAGIQGTEWIISSFLWMAEREKPDFSYIYLPHLDYASQKLGPNSPAAMEACKQLDEQLGKLFEKIDSLYEGKATWLIASEYAVNSVSHVSYPNQVLREAGLLETRLDEDGKERIDHELSDAWALVDHQHSHIFVRNRNAQIVEQVSELFAQEEGIDTVLAGTALEEVGIAHSRTGDVVLVSEPHSWQAYYWWLDEAMAPSFARNVDIHQKPGYDPVEMFFDPSLMQAHGGGIPLDASLVKGSHGATSKDSNQGCLVLSNEADLIGQGSMRDITVTPSILKHFGVMP